ncbi:MAG: formate dehydrogenase accessory sulfurtransferase FdhD [Candidatus Thorarchaeota archaeon]|nr:formate dehydrogenase accessory sulfurtransferase FdhD [Candidatus Thorarchaeota archaeon]
MIKPETEIECQRIIGESRVQMKEQVAAESYLELIIDEKNHVEFSFTAGFEEQLVIGNLIAAGKISDLKDIVQMELIDKRCTVRLSKSSVNEEEIENRRLKSVDFSKILEAGDILKLNQPHHKATRGFHAAIIMELTSGKWFACEDIGRHNAVDKVLGYGLQNGYKLSNSLMLLTGRLFSNIVQKAVNAGVAVIASLTVATDRGILIAKDSDTTLVGTLSKEGSWLYHEGMTKIRT